MERLTTLELKKLVSTSLCMEVFAVRKGDSYVVSLSTKGQGFTIRSQRDETRKFKSLSAVQSMLNSAGITTFSVIG